MGCDVTSAPQKGMVSADLVPAEPAVVKENNSSTAECSDDDVYAGEPVSTPKSAEFSTLELDKSASRGALRAGPGTLADRFLNRTAYTTQAGDLGLRGIAQELGIEFAALEQANQQLFRHGRDPGMIYPGEPIFLPKGFVAPAGIEGVAEFQMLQVRAGDTFYGIADKSGMSRAELRLLNTQFDSPQRRIGRIYPGEWLLLARQTTAPLPKNSEPDDRMTEVAAQATNTETKKVKAETKKVKTETKKVKTETKKAETDLQTRAVPIGSSTIDRATVSDAALTGGTVKTTEGGHKFSRSLTQYLNRVEFKTTFAPELGGLFDADIKVSSRVVTAPKNAAQKAFVKANPGAVVVRLQVEGQLKADLPNLGPLAGVLGKAKASAKTKLVIEVPIMPSGSDGRALGAVVTQLRNRLSSFTVSSSDLDLTQGTRFAINTELAAGADLTLKPLSKAGLGADVAVGLKTKLEITQLAENERAIKGSTTWTTGLDAGRKRALGEVGLKFGAKRTHTIVRSWSTKLDLSNAAHQKAAGLRNPDGAAGPKLFDTLGIPWKQDWKVSTMLAPTVGAKLALPVGAVSLKFGATNKASRLVSVKLPDPEHSLTASSARKLADMLAELDLKTFEAKAPDGTKVTQYFKHGTKVDAGLGIGIPTLGYNAPGLKIEAGVGADTSIEKNGITRLEVTRKRGKTLATLEKKASDTRAWSVYARIEASANVGKAVAPYMPDVAEALEGEFVGALAEPLVSDIEDFVEETLSVGIEIYGERKTTEGIKVALGPFDAANTTHLIAFDELKAGKPETALGQGLWRSHKATQGRSKEGGVSANFSKLAGMDYKAGQSVDKTITTKKTARGIKRSGEVEGVEWVSKMSHFLGFGETYATHFPMVTERGSDGKSSTVAEGYYWIRDKVTRAPERGYWDMWTRELGLEIDEYRDDGGKIGKGEGALYLKVDDLGIRQLLAADPDVIALRYLEVSGRYYGGGVPPSERLGKLPLGYRAVTAARSLLRGYDWGELDDDDDEISGKELVRKRFYERYGVSGDEIATAIHDYIDPFRVAGPGERERLAEEYSARYGSNLLIDAERVRAADLLEGVMDPFDDEDEDDAIEEYESLTGRDAAVDARIVKDAEQLRADMFNIQSAKRSTDAAVKASKAQEENMRAVLSGFELDGKSATEKELAGFEQVYEKAGDLAENSRPGSTMWFGRYKEESFAIKIATLLSMVSADNRQTWLNYQADGFEVLAHDAANPDRPARLDKWLGKVQSAE